MNCIKCKYNEVNEQGSTYCYKEIGNQGLVCLLKNLLRTHTLMTRIVISNGEEGLKMFKTMIEKTEEDMNEGEEWKKGKKGDK